MAPGDLLLTMIRLRSARTNRKGMPLMSLFDYLNNDGSSTSSTNSSLSLLQQIAAQQGISVPSTVLNALGGDSTSATNASAVQISSAAQSASAEAADADKDADKLSAELRATLDKGGADASMSAFSGRGLSIIALNQDGTFSRAEVYGAKAELRERDRQSAITFLNSGDLTASSLKTYSQQLLASRQSMSAEEQALRDSDPNLR